MIRALILTTVLLSACAPGMHGPEEPAEDDVLGALIDAYESGVATEDQLLVLLSLVIQRPDHLEARGVNVDSVRTDLLSRLEHRIDIPHPHGYEVPADHGSPQRYFAEAMRAYRHGDVTTGDSLFALTLDNSDSNAQRADFYYARRRSGDINNALRVFPSHGPSLYQRAVNIGNAIGRPTSLTGRFAYWCVADEFRNVAARTTDGQIASLARTAAARYERSGPSREQYELEGWRLGDTVEADLGTYGTCTTRVR